MRLLHTKRLKFEEFFDGQIPPYAILSHRWGPPDEEVSYVDFMGGNKRWTSGWAKILSFCGLASSSLYGLDYGWIDTCCIVGNLIGSTSHRDDKTSSAELSEAINSMFRWYARADICFAYLQDIYDVSELSVSDWFTRGWTLQELIAPAVIKFFDKQWQALGTREELVDEIYEASRIDEHLLVGYSKLENYSVAQIMSWAAHRSTSRVEDQAYCLLGLFDVNMPLLYGEGARAFQRLQAEILAKAWDNSLLTWDIGSETCQHSVFAPSPSAFRYCGNITWTGTTPNILFEVNNRGMLVLIHRNQDSRAVDSLLRCAVKSQHCIRLTIPLDCRTTDNPAGGFVPAGCEVETFHLQLIGTATGDWHRVGVARRMEVLREVYQEGTPLSYTNDYVRIYVHHQPYNPDSSGECHQGVITSVGDLNIRSVYTQ